MFFDHDVQYTPGQDIGHADAMSRLRFKDDEDDLVAVACHGLVPARGDERSYQKPNQREMGNDSLRDQGPNRERHTSHTQKRRRKAAPDVKSQAITLVFWWRVQVILPTGPC